MMTSWLVSGLRSRNTMGREGSAPPAYIGVEHRQPEAAWWCTGVAGTPWAGRAARRRPARWTWSKEGRDEKDESIRQQALIMNQEGRATCLPARLDSASSIAAYSRKPEQLMTHLRQVGNGLRLPVRQQSPDRPNDAVMQPAAPLHFAPASGWQSPLLPSRAAAPARPPGSARWSSARRPGCSRTFGTCSQGMRQTSSVAVMKQIRRGGQHKLWRWQDRRVRRRQQAGQKCCEAWA